MCGDKTFPEKYIMGTTYLAASYKYPLRPIAYTIVINTILIPIYDLYTTNDISFDA